MKLGDKIKFVREKRGWTQAELSERSGVSKSYIAGIETGEKYNIPIETLRKLAKALEVDLSFIVSSDAVTLDELSKLTGNKVPDEIAKFISEQESIDYIMLSKKAKEQGVPLNIFEMLLKNYLDAMDKK